MPVILFVLKNSPYKEIGLDCYDEERDARSYSGSLPVVAHPPCQLWGKMAVVNYRRWGGEHNRPGNDGGLFKFALDTVNRCGGVLEHPALSMAWKEYGLVKPLKDQWTKSGEGWTCEVWQSAYGHKANKKTWLYYKGVEKPEDPLWDKPKGTHQIGFQDRRGKNRNKPALGKYEANATPPQIYGIPVKDCRKFWHYRVKNFWKICTIPAITTTCPDSEVVGSFGHDVCI